jgi:hypothetical protein
MKNTTIGTITNYADYAGRDYDFDVEIKTPTKKIHMACGDSMCPTNVRIESCDTCYHSYTVQTLPENAEVIFEGRDFVIAQIVK